eukprot:26747_1
MQIKIMVQHVWMDQFLYFIIVQLKIHQQPINGMFFFEGGGACVGAEVAADPPCFDSCEHRAGTDLGSSNSYPSRSNYDNGYMSTSKSVNPLTYDWNTVYIKYCDGASYTGDNSTTQKAGKYELHYRGRRNMQG